MLNPTYGPTFLVCHVLETKGSSCYPPKHNTPTFTF